MMNKNIHQIIDEFSNAYPLLGRYLNLMDIIEDNKKVQTAGICFNKHLKTWTIYINTDYFLGKLDEKQRVAVLLHEIYHFLFLHPLRVLEREFVDVKTYNLAADLVVNQYISDLPDERFDLAYVKKKYKKDLPPDKSVSYYYGCLDNINSDIPYMGQENHELWEHLSGEDKNNAIEEAGNMMEVANKSVGKEKKKEKTSEDSSGKGYSIDTAISYFEHNIKNMVLGIRSRDVLKRAIKKTICGCQERTLTWTRPSKRYGVYAKGTKDDNIPSVTFYIDTSGSIESSTLSSFFAIIEEMIKVGEAKYKVKLFHEKLYKELKYDKAILKTIRNGLQSGGTNLTEVVSDIYASSKNDLSVILTDGEYSDVNFEERLKVTPREKGVVFLISKGGTLKHPLARLGETIGIF